MTILRKTLLAASLWASLLSPLAAMAQAPPAVGALPDQERRTAYSLTGSTCICAINLQLYASGTDFDAAIQVWVNGVRYLSTDPTFGWSLSSTSTGGFATGARPITNAVLTFNQSITGTVQIVGAERPRQLAQFSENTGVPARALNQRMTEITAVERELWDKTNDLTGRGLFFAPGNTTGPMPQPSACASNYLAFDATGKNPVCQPIIGAGSFVGVGNGLSNNAGTISTSFNVVPVGGLTLYASASGSDTNNTCTASGTPCTLKGACNVRSQFAMFLAGTATINIAHGTYSSLDSNSNVCTQNGNGGNGPILTTFLGDCGSPSSVIISVPANATGFGINDLSEADIKCLTIIGGNGSVGVNGGQFTVLDIDTVHYGAFGTSSVHAAWGQHSHYNLAGGGEFIDGGATIHWQMRSNAFLSGAAGTTITTNVAFTIFLDTRGAVYVDLSSWILTNSSTVTGQRANLVGPGYLLTGNSSTTCNALLPGNSACVLTLGFQDQAGDATTSGLVTPPSISLTGLTASLGASVTMTTSGTAYDGPSVAQGTSGTWFASGNATVAAANSADHITCKLWDGTTLIDSGYAQAPSTLSVSIHLSGMLVSPAANLKITCTNNTSNGGTIAKTNGVDNNASTLTAFRIQ